MSRHFFWVLATLVALSSCTSNTKDDAEQLLNEGDLKIFRFNIADGLSSLDPAFARNQANTWLVTQLYSGLFELGEDMNPVPNLASSAEVSADGLEYTITLKRGVFFHDNKCFPDGKGRRLTAKDVVYSFNRIIDEEVQSTGAWIFKDKAKKAADGSIDKDWIRADDLATVKITLEKPFGPFLSILAMPYASIVPWEAVKVYGPEFRTNPVGSGPFKFKSWTEGESLILLKNDNFWKYDAEEKRLPYIDAAQISFIPDKHQEFLTFRQGKIDFMSGIQATFADHLLKKDGTIKDEFTGQFKVQKLPYLNTEYVGFVVDPESYTNKDHPILNKKFRQALSYAVNREELVRFLLNNLGMPANKGVIPPLLVGYDQSDMNGYNYDRGKAEALLVEAGYGPGGQKPPSIKVYTSVQYKEIVEYLQKQWAEIGVTVEIETNPAPVHQEIVDNGKVKFFRGSWIGDYTDAENYLTCFYSKNMAPAGPNKTRFSNATFDSLYEQSLVQTDDTLRYQIYKQMDAIVLEECPVIVLYYDEVIRLVQNNLTGLETNPMNVLKLEKVDLEVK